MRAALLAFLGAALGAAHADLSFAAADGATWALDVSNSTLRLFRQDGHRRAASYRFRLRGVLEVDSRGGVVCSLLGGGHRASTAAFVLTQATYLQVSKHAQAAGIARLRLR